VEHPAEFHVRHRLLDLPRVVFEGDERRIVVLRAGEVEQLDRIPYAFVGRAEAVDDCLERFLLLAELLRALAVVPDVRVFQKLADLAQPRTLAIVVKDTSAAGRRGSRGRSAGTLWR